MVPWCLCYVLAWWCKHLSWPFPRQMSYAILVNWSSPRDSTMNNFGNHYALGRQVCYPPKAHSAEMAACLFFLIMDRIDRWSIFNRIQKWNCAATNFKWIALNENECVSIEISLNLASKGRMYNKPAPAQMMGNLQTTIIRIDDSRI